MTRQSTTRWSRFGATLATLVLAGALVTTANHASFAQQRPTSTDILEALKPAPKTRGLTTTPKQMEDQKFLQTIRGRTRALTLDERTKVADIAKDKQKIDLEVYFDYNSAEIVQRAVPDLMELGKALSSPDLRGGTFLLGGHTDAKGGEEYNQKLSERRAASVKRFLLEKFQIPEESLVTAGYGKEQLKKPDQPFAGENRRVQIVNLEVKQSASK
ncbi:OmpA family protein [Rhodoplanes sp. TEM]|uniref:OmpA family protein n=1 Tax=Rhodoplanes tepidamans TaxID=200616 RepID=A0ABT5J4S3_RHOTP|nr:MULTISPECIES: OmpA family protein [Rhodoplanes]MDC7784635.1 OmpA family protein [Rhodoplanes tepidamans]MDC7982927.1 OmpA family protein [Rhodoplanes sp. TEM]MDQ0355863.1 outer membrane protein OmpA-like peptidoglycan-associated protein [Rhodoplanes tepidamans]